MARETEFDTAAEAAGLNEEDRDRIWRKLLKLRMNPNDPGVIFLIASGHFERVMEVLPRLVSAIPAQVGEAARAAVDPVTKAATAQVTAAHAKLSAETGERVGELVAERIDAEFRTRRLRDAGIVAIAALALALLVGWIGYGLGTRTIAGLDASVRAIAARPDLSTVLRILTGNPDLNAVIGSYCASGSSAVRVVEGVRNCSLPLWIDGRPASLVPSYGGQPIVTLWNSGAAVLNRFSGWTVLGMGLVLGLILKRLFAIVGRIVGFKVVST